MSGGQTVFRRCGALRLDHVCEARDHERQDDDTGGSEARRRPCTSQRETCPAIPDGGDRSRVGVPEERKPGGRDRGRLCFRRQWRRGPGMMGPWNMTGRLQRPAVHASSSYSAPPFALPVLAVSTSQYKPRHIFLADAAPAV
ncbi:hypothetical protein MTO96_034662, partial [Rhipicephalus appendiculatus]